MSEPILLEIGVEEIPHKVLTPTLRQLEEKVPLKLSEAGIEFSKVSVYGTPRRLALYIEGVGETTLKKNTEKRGPAVQAAFDASGQPTRALLGFLQSSGAKVEDVKRKKIGNGEYVVLESCEGGNPVADVLPGLFAQLIQTLEFPKNMHWGEGSFTFVRPIQWLVLLHGSKALPLTVAGIQSGAVTRGHRILSQGLLEIKHASDYLDVLKKGSVFADPAERKSEIERQIAARAKEVNCRAILDDTLLDTLVNLTEFPQVAVGEYEKEFLELPREVLISEMVEHQKYVPLEDMKGVLTHLFLITANIPSNPTIVGGNARVIRSRFSDGKFFFDEDRKKKLEDYLPRLSTVLYAKGLGTMMDKVERIQQITVAIAHQIGYGDAVANALRAAYLCKADLTSNMVNEFPELQGIIGGYYAAHSGENKEVATSVREHYAPRFSGDELPSLKEGILVSLADRLDNLFAMYSRGNFVTGSKDPFALRRQTLGVIRILIEKKIHLDLAQLFKKVMPLYAAFLTMPEAEFSSKILEFITSRIKTVFKEYGFAHDEIDAAITRDVSDIYDAYLRVTAIHEARSKESFIHLAVAFKRVKNILKDQKVGEFSKDILKEEAEKALASGFENWKEKFTLALEGKKYGECVAILSEFRPLVDRFFEEVMVMDKDAAVKNNRLALLSGIDRLFSNLLDFDRIVTE